MKLMTINTHSLLEKNSEQKRLVLENAIFDEKPDIIAMQEVNQTADAPASKHNPMADVQSKILLRDDNYAAAIINGLYARGDRYYGAWLPIKNGYKKYDEGLAVLSRLPIIETDNILMSEIDDYTNWKTRRALGIKTEKGWFYSVHMGWWDDNEEPFYKQWKKLYAAVKEKQKVWLMGDFNSDCEVRDEGYDSVISSGWYDSYTEAEKKDSGFTVENVIDGWRDKEHRKLRIDYIFSNYKTKVESSSVIFNNKNRNVISDHYGIIIKTAEQ